MDRARTHQGQRGDPVRAKDPTWRGMATALLKPIADKGSGNRNEEKPCVFSLGIGESSLGEEKETGKSGAILEQGCIQVQAISRGESRK